MLAELEIREVAYTHGDAQALIARVQQVYVERYGGADDDTMDPSMFTPPAGAFFVGYLADAPVATGAWRAEGVERLGSDNTAEIKRMYVVPEAARQGHARTMLAHLESTAVAAGHEVMVLSTGSLQPEAIALYLSSGYVEVAPFGHYAEAELVRCFAKRLAM
ncbi:N-acetyltransferase [Nocardioides baekrokdamisoli]|uniref:N-acetyltransferase n=1 Tax=Nocardioides baekrokdamisoli TaxID=1804624 RepID=A0A3G9ITI4_9ACTN|nr:GNAT family N-acetyltransferase [Nocardioides baekrokdamisoli]BBH16941.1 N-acetyltransferase [Nocardioides baekrokdamisoli]